MRKAFFLGVFGALFVLLTLHGSQPSRAATERSEAPRELGVVAWERDFGRASARAEATGKPLFTLFQEVPGCQTCVSFGDQVLRHPLLVEAIEDEFVAVAVFNNRGGADRAVLQRFGEPAWNNPVVRYLGSDGSDLIPRRSGVYGPYEVGRRMVAALEKAGRPVPGYLRAAVDELAPRHTERATFAMHCFWSGEACIGEIDGVRATRAGFQGGGLFGRREVVEVVYDPGRIGTRALLEQVRARGCADAVFAEGDAQRALAESVFPGRVESPRGRFQLAPASDQKRALLGSRLEALDLTPWQALRVNTAVAAGRSPAAYLSPRQRRAAGLAPGVGSGV